MMTYYVTCFSTVDRRQAPQTILICCVVEFYAFDKIFEYQKYTKYVYSKQKQSQSNHKKVIYIINQTRNILRNTVTLLQDLLIDKRTIIET